MYKLKEYFVFLSTIEGRKMININTVNLLGLDFTNLQSRITKLIFFFNHNQCQSTIVLKPDSPTEKHRDYLLTFNFLINYIDKSYIHTRMLIDNK